MVEAVKNEIARLGGNILSVDDWGKKRLAYQIQNQKYGNYVLVRLETENNTLVRQLHEWMKLNSGILSQLTTELDHTPDIDENVDTSDDDEPGSDDEE
jgi:small subunit ribosomal protein S6